LWDILGELLVIVIGAFDAILDGIWRLFNRRNRQG
jgi:hypothetical protein